MALAPVAASNPFGKAAGEVTGEAVLNRPCCATKLSSS